MAQAQKISTCLWFDTAAQDAAEFYVSLFDDSRIVKTNHYGRNAPMPEGTVLTVEFDLAGTRFMALNGGPHFKLSEAASIVVRCDTQAELDRLWDVLTADGGQASKCGWLKDRYGLSWQIVPIELAEMLQDDDRATTDRVMSALMKMEKLDVEVLKAAHRGDAT